MKIASYIAAGSMVHSLAVFAPWLAFAGVREIAGDPRSWLFLVLVNLFYAAELTAMRHAAVRASGSAREIDRRLHRLSLASCAAVLLIFWAAELEAQFTTAMGWSMMAGAFVMMVGAVLRGLAIAELGRQFVSEASRPGDAALVQSGVYGWMRHPSETGLIFIAAGASLLMGSRAAGLLCAAALLPLIVVRIRLEEHGLRTAFGAEFDRYRARVPAFTPRLL